MRCVAVGALFVLLPLSVYASPLTIPAASVVMPDTPSGKGDPNTIVCRAPQRLADSDQFGPKACGYNSEWWQLTAHGKDLAPDGKTVIDKKSLVIVPAKPLELSKSYLVAMSPGLLGAVGDLGTLWQGCEMG